MIHAPPMFLGWEYSLASILHQLEKLHPRMKHSMGKMSIEQLEHLIRSLDHFIQSSDGIFPKHHQMDLSQQWANLEQNENYDANHLNALNTTQVVNGILNFIQNTIASEEAENVSILFIGPQWLIDSGISLAYNELNEALGMENPNLTVFDFTELQPVSEASIIEQSNLLNPCSKINAFIPSLEVSNHERVRELFALQLNIICEHIANTNGGKVFLIGHSIGGLFLDIILKVEFFHHKSRPIIS